MVTRPNGKKATRLCRCGYLSDAERACSRAPRCARDYQSRISGPMFDRIDMHIEVPAVSASDLRLPPPAEVAARAAAARDIQTERYRGLATKGQPICTNAQADGELLQHVAQPDSAGETLLTEATERMKLSARSYHRMLRVARTLADMEEVEKVTRIHIAEALSYRRLDLGQ
jgi:magnesium chelatase family protein